MAICRELTETKLTQAPKPTQLISLTVWQLASSKPGSQILLIHLKSGGTTSRQLRALSALKNYHLCPPKYFGTASLPGTSQGLGAKIGGEP